MKRKPAPISVWSIVSLGLVIVSFAAGQLLNSVTYVHAGSGNASAVYASNVTADFQCQLDRVAVFSTRFDFHCTTATSGIDYFTYSTEGSNAALGNRMLMIANTVFSLGNSIYFGYETDAANNLPGCLAVNCRNLVWVSARP